MTPAKISPSQIIKKAVSHDLPTVVETGIPDFELDLEEHKLHYELESLQQQLVEAVDTHNLRMGYSDKIFILVCIWLTCVLASIIFSGFNIWGFELSDKVLITFITSTTINVLGLFAIVAKWLFPQNGNSNTKKKKPSNKKPKSE